MSWRNRVLDHLNEHAMELIFEDFAEGRIAGLIKRGELTTDDIGKRFAEEVRSCLETEREIRGDGE